jgi:hypothetical protein
MNKLFFISIFFTVSTTSACQVSQKTLNEAKSTWQGIWQGVNGKDTITIYITHTKHPKETFSERRTFVSLYGWHRIVQDGVVVENSSKSTNTSWNAESTVSCAYHGVDKNLSILVKDITRNRLLDGEMIFLKSNKAILKTQLKETYRNDDKVYPEGQTFPKEIKIIRISPTVILPKV